MITDQGVVITNDITIAMMIHHDHDDHRDHEHHKDQINDEHHNDQSDGDLEAAVMIMITNYMTIIDMILIL